MVEKLPRSADGVIGFRMTGKLTDEDYKIFVPQVEEVIDQHGKARFLAWFDQFEGWDLHALWEDIKFATKHFNDIARIAIVGDKKWEEWMAKVCSPFTLATVEYFDVSKLDSAWDWIEADESAEE